MTVDNPRHVASRLHEAGIDPSDRFIDVRDGSKQSPVKHQQAGNRHGPDGVRGNYGIYVGDNLIAVDVDVYETEADAADIADDPVGLAEVNALPVTFTVKTPHTSGVVGGHRLYRVVPGKEFDTAAEALEATTTNTCAAKRPWGDLKVERGYIVGPGSQLDECDKDGCDECETPDGGRYQVAADRPIAEITADDLAKLLRASSRRNTPRESCSPGCNPGDTAGKPPSGASDMDVDCGFDGSDDDLIEAAANGQKGRRFADLWAGRWKDRDYPSQSEADLALCGELAFWTGPDPDRVDRLFRRSGLMREKWEVHTNYAERTVDKAINGRTTFYDPARGGAAPGAATPTLADGGAAVDPVPDGVNPESIVALAGLGEDGTVADLTDREKAAYVWKLIQRTDEFHVRVLRDNGALWAYDDDAGVWTHEGERALRRAARQALGPANYGKYVFSELEEQVRADPDAEIHADALGLDPGLLAVANGLLDLDKAAAGLDALRPLRPDDHALVRLPVEYDPDATADRWRALVDEWAEDGRADALQEFVGYCLHVGAIPFHRALLLVGSGANGKGTFLHVARALLGAENTTSIELQTLANERDAVAEFYGKLANIDDDLSARKLGGGLGMFKKLVAGDRVRARRLYEAGFEFRATGKHLYAANEVPQVDVPDDDEAFWRRWLLVEFPNHYPPSERDPSLKEQLTEPTTLSGVLNWAIEGRARLFDQGYFTNEEHDAYAKRERWQRWGESVDTFISDCVEHDPDAPRISTQDAHRRYAAWCRENGHDPVLQTKLTTKLKTAGVEYRDSIRIGERVTRGYAALGLSDDVPSLDTTPDRAPDPGRGRQDTLG